MWQNLICPNYFRNSIFFLTPKDNPAAAKTINIGPFIGSPGGGGGIGGGGVPSLTVTCESQINPVKTNKIEAIRFLICFVI